MGKTFDCVEMKREAQRRLTEEYEARKDEFDSFTDFIRARADESPLAKRTRARIARNID